MLDAQYWERGTGEKEDLDGRWENTNPLFRPNEFLHGPLHSNFSSYDTCASLVRPRVDGIRQRWEWSIPVSRMARR